MNKVSRKYYHIDLPTYMSINLSSLSMTISKSIYVQIKMNKSTNVRSKLTLLIKLFTLSKEPRCNFDITCHPIPIRRSTLLESVFVFFPSARYQQLSELMADGHVPRLPSTTIPQAGNIVSLIKMTRGLETGLVVRKGG